MVERKAYLESGITLEGYCGDEGLSSPLAKDSLKYDTLAGTHLDVVFDKMLKQDSLFYAELAEKLLVFNDIDSVSDVDPFELIIVIEETYLQNKDNVNIKGYITKVRRDRDCQGGGVMIAIKEKYSHVYAEVVEVENKEIELEQIWIYIG